MFAVKQCYQIVKKCLIWILAFSTIFFLIVKVTCLVTLFDRQLQVFKNSPNWTLFDIFNELLSTQNATVARFARNVEWEFFFDFQTQCYSSFCQNLLFWTFNVVWSTVLLKSVKMSSMVFLDSRLRDRDHHNDYSESRYFGLVTTLRCSKMCQFEKRIVV